MRATLTKSLSAAFSAALFAAGMLSPAFAGPERIDCDSWTGAYVGAYFGAGAGTANQSFTDSQAFRQVIIVPGQILTFDTTESGAGELSGDVTGSVVDLFAGYNFHPGSCSKFVFGAQLEGTAFSDITLKSTGRRDSTSNTTQTTVPTGGGGTTVVTSTDTQSGTSESTDELRSMFAFIGRAGFLAGPYTLIYGLAGLPLGNFVVPDSDDPFGGDRSQWELGYTGGAGLEHKFNKHWSIRAEYRFVHFEVDRDQSTSSASTTVQGTTSFTFESTFTRSQSTCADFHLGKVGIVFGF